MRLVKCIALFLITVLLFCGCDKKQNEEEIKESKFIGTTGVRLNNGGHVAEYGDWIFFSTIHGVYREKKDGTNYGKISDKHFVYYMNATKDYVYYMDVGEKKCYRMHHDGSNNEVFIDKYCADLYVVDDYIYYTECEYDDGGSLNYNGFYRVRLDNSEKEIIINDDACWYIDITEDGIYWSSSNGVYTCDFDGNNKKQLSEEKLVDFVVHKDKIYTYKPLAVYDADFKNGKVLCEEEIRMFDFDDDWIYFRKESDLHNIYRMKTDGSQTEMFLEGDTWGLSIINDWLFYYTGDTFDFYRDDFRIRLDGSRQIKQIYMLVIPGMAN